MRGDGQFLAEKGIVPGQQAGLLSRRCCIPAREVLFVAAAGCPLLGPVQTVIHLNVHRFNIMS
jgi:hypothetical protein